MYFDDISVYGINAEFGDAVFTVYKISITPDTKEAKPPMYHSHFYYECHFLLEGETQYLILGDSVTATGGSVVIIPPQAEHYPFQGTNGAKEIVLGLMLKQNQKDTGMFRYFLQTLCDIAGKPVKLTEQLLQCITQFYDSFQDATIRDICFRQARAYEIIVQLFDSINRFCIRSEALEVINRKEDRNIVLEFMINDAGFSLQDIASEMGYSVRHTYRMIVEKYGKSFTEIRQKNMLTTAKRLLVCKPSYSLETVAIRSGFPGKDAMARAFRKWDHTTPTEYRRGNMRE